MAPPGRVGYADQPCHEGCIERNCRGLDSAGLRKQGSQLQSLRLTTYKGLLVGSSRSSDRAFRCPSALNRLAMLGFCHAVASAEEQSRVHAALQSFRRKETEVSPYVLDLRLMLLLSELALVH